MGDEQEPTQGQDPRASQVGPRRLRWLPVIFLVSALLVLGLGIWFKLQEAPPAESRTLMNGTSQMVGIYVNQPGVTVHLTAGITWDPSQPGQARETLYAAVEGGGVTPGTTLLFTSTVRPSGSSPSEPSAVYTGRALVRGSAEWVWSRTVAQLDSVSGQYGSVVADFTLPQVAQVSGGDVFVHLPELASNVSPFPSVAIEMTEQATSAVGAPVQDVVTSPALLDQAEAGIASYTSSTASYIGKAGGSSRELYYEPQPLAATETINNLRPYLLNAVIDSNLPGDGTLQQGTYVWQATGSLEAYLSATEVSTSNSEANDGFYAGLAFATAAALALASAQEFKDPMTSSPRRFGRRRQPPDSEPAR
jgi:hypothetical protein